VIPGVWGQCQLPVRVRFLPSKVIEPTNVALGASLVVVVVAGAAAVAAAGVIE
jgi:hypothetical protein